MPLEVKIHKEITEYKEKIIFGLSIRQLICVIIAVLLCTATFFVVRPFIGKDLAGYLVLLEAAPVMGVGFLRINGFTFEQYVAIVLRHTFGHQIRIYKTELSVDYIDYYGDFGMTVGPSEELISRVKKEKFFGIRGEALKGNLETLEYGNNKFEAKDIKSESDKKIIKK